MKWLGPVAMATLIAASCSQDRDEPLLADPSPAVKTAASGAGETAPAPSVEGIPAGEYALDPAHASLVFSANHLGFSNYTAQFTRFSADLKLDPANPEAAQLTAKVDPHSLLIPSPPEGFLDELKGENWINAGAFPEITFQSTSIVMKAPNAADVTGDLTLNGVTKPITLEITYNGGYAGHAQEPNARIGFSARGAFKRSDFGIDYGVPAPGSTMGVSDEVRVSIEAEFIGPPLSEPA